MPKATYKSNQFQTRNIPTKGVLLEKQQMQHYVANCTPYKGSLLHQGSFPNMYYHSAEEHGFLCWGLRYVGLVTLEFRCKLFSLYRNERPQGIMQTPPIYLIHFLR